MIFNTKYGITSFIVLPYYIFFEFAVPLLEIVGLVLIALDIAFFEVNYSFLIIISISMYLFYTFVTLISIYLDQLINKQYSGLKDILKLP
jgi:hypothetical protein